MKHIGFCLLPVLFLAAELNATTSYEEWKRSTQSDFRAYKDANDQAFVEFLQQSWQEVDVDPAQKRDPSPKPKIPVQAKPTSTQPDSTPAVKVEPKPLITPTLPAPKPLVASTLPILNFEYFGHQIRIPYPARLKSPFRGSLNNEGIAQYWKNLSQVDIGETVSALKQQGAALGLNDWGMAMLIDQFSKALHRDNASRQLTTWYLLVKSGFDARIAYNDRIFLLLPSEQEIFGVTFFTLNNKRYYSVNLNDIALKPGKVFTYDGQHGNGKKALNFSDSSNFSAHGKILERNFNYFKGNKRYPITVSYPQQHIQYLASYPQLALPNYFQAGLPANTANQLLTQLQPLINTLSELEAVNALLTFVQTAFDYQTDDVQFKEENYLFPLETLHYPYSDCEDRAALFAWLVESLLKLDVIIVNYPGHVATAVKFSSDVAGDAITVGGKRYVIADPTYTNATAGMSMPTLNLKQAKAIAY